MEKKYKAINVRKEDYEILETLAKRSKRTMLGMFSQVLEDWCIDEADINAKTYSARPQTITR